MDHTKVLRRVEADIAAGDLALARVRLASVLSRSENTEIRAALVRVCRLAGDPAAAGRYAFLTDDVTASELLALFRRNGDRADLVLRAVGDRPPLTVAAQDRVAELRRRVLNDRRGAPTGSSTGSVADALGGIGCALVMLLVGVIVVLGAISGVRIVAGWF